MEPEDLESITEMLRRRARIDHACRVPFDDVKSEPHRKILTDAIRNVLSTELAHFTYAQIIDGLPTADVAWDRRAPGIFGDHIIDDVHEELCPGAMDAARDFYEKWDPSVLDFNPKVVHDYQDATPGTKTFNLRLIELVAVALHQIGALLFKLDLRLHKGDIESVVLYKEKPFGWRGPCHIYPRATLFNHPHYLDDDVYPEGLADVVGYWAEDRILGGVAIFDRRRDASPSDNTDPPPNVYFHSCRDRVTDRPYQLLDEQQELLLSFLLGSDTSSCLPSSSAPPPCPLPILGGKQNRTRVDYITAITRDQIYRDIWERKPPTKQMIRLLQRRPQDEIDYPEIRDHFLRIQEQLGIPLPRRPSSRSQSPANE